MIIMKVCDMMEVALSHSRSLFLFVALLISFVPRIVPWRSWRNCGVIAIVSIMVFVQLYVCIVGRPAMFRIPIALAAIFALYFVCLLIWKPVSITPWAVRQRIIVLAYAFAVMLPMWFWGENIPSKLCRVDAHGYGVIPAEILGLQTSATGNTNGMIRKVESRHFGGTECEIAYLEDKIPRKVDGPIFVSAVIRCTEKTRQTVGVIADSGIMLQSDEHAVMDIAQTVAGEVSRVCGIEMKRPIYSSIRRGKSDIVNLFSGHGGNIVAEVVWVGQGNGKGLLRLLLHDTGSIREKSLLHAEIMAK